MGGAGRREERPERPGGAGDREPGHSRLDRNPELADALEEFVRRVDLESPDLDAELQRLAGRHGTAVFSELIFLLCHLHFDGEEALRCWQQVLAHRERMQEQLKSPVDLRVALVSYFLQVNRKLENPKIIELKLFEQTQASAHRDELTGLYNYRFFSEFLPYEILRAERASTPLSLVMVDIDDFKHYNDLNGHEAGNVVLSEVARSLTATLHKADIASRYGGEEFALILPSIPKKDAQLVAERIRARIEEHRFSNAHRQPGGALTVSIGIATFPGDARETGELIRCADRAMYAAKAEGKNQVWLHGDSLRSYRRVDADVQGSFRCLAGETMPFTCINLSEGGLRMLADRSLPPGALIEATLRLPGPQGAILITGRVVQVNPTGSGQYVIGSRIVNTDAQGRQRLVDYVRQLTACE
jgi:diguanylate cyclase (GGDEF)-like protein